MLDPMRLQLSRAPGFNLRAHSLTMNRLPAIVCARPGRLGNPFPVGTYSRPMSVAMHRLWLQTEEAEDLGYRGDVAKTLNDRRKAVLEHLKSARGHNMACWCELPALGQRDECHCLVLLELANG